MLDLRLHMHLRPSLSLTDWPLQDTDPDLEIDFVDAQVRNRKKRRALEPCMREKSPAHLRFGGLAERRLSIRPSRSFLVDPGAQSVV